MSDGYWALIRPLSVGTHTIAFGGAFPPGQFTLLPGVFHGDVGVPSVGYMAESAYAGYLVWYPPNEAPAASEKRLTAGVSSTPSAPAAPSFKKSSWVFSVWRWV